MNTFTAFAGFDFRRQPLRGSITYRRARYAPHDISDEASQNACSHEDIIPGRRAFTLKASHAGTMRQYLEKEQQPR